MRHLRRVALSLSAAVLVAGCGGGPDDELEPREPTTITVTEEPESSAVPDELPFGEAAPTGEVVWAQGTVLHRGSTAQELAPISPEAIVVVPGGLLLLAGAEVWLTDGREAVSLGFSPVSDLAVSRDGSQVLVLTEDRDAPVGYALDDGARVDDDQVGRPRSDERVVRGPGRFEVRGGDPDLGADGASAVTDAAGRPVTVEELPADFAPEAWLDQDRVAGLATIEGEATVHVCDLAPETGPARCDVVPDPVSGSSAAGYVFASRPAG